MKNWIKKQYWEVRYNVTNVPLEDLRGIIWTAWEATPESYIKSLYDSWWDRCRAVIEANERPTRY